ncbi:hypothetical protein GCM10009839_07330 [Catenulispora yoronensis]|uniref:Thioredoxin domain-containing protein n=1 Tax=Catenulispora yoronensis TaxID=450799 RepID=A0ABP5F6T9_9ACTN
MVVGAIGCLNLLLTFGVVRRLREHTTLLAEGQGGGYPRARPDAGAVIDAFEATTTTGEPVSPAALKPDTLVGFFSSTCEPCAKLLPEFVKTAAGLPGGRDQVLAIVAGDAVAAAPLVEALSPVARLVAADDARTVGAAFGVEAFPSLFVVGPDARTAASAGDLTALRRQAPSGMFR